MQRLNRPHVLVALILAAASLVAAPGAYAIDADADRILRAMGDYLQSAKEFSFRADITREETLSTRESG
jgi:hypothetical protein